MAPLVSNAECHALEDRLGYDHTLSVSLGFCNAFGYALSVSARTTHLDKRKVRRCSGDPVPWARVLLTIQLLWDHRRLLRGLPS